MKTHKPSEMQDLKTKYEQLEGRHNALKKNFDIFKWTIENPQKFNLGQTVEFDHLGIGMKTSGIIADVEIVEPLYGFGITYGMPEMVYRQEPKDRHRRYCIIWSNEKVWKDEDQIKSLDSSIGYPAGYRVNKV